MVTPLADVAIGEKGPRYSEGASGLRSHMSICDEPPHKKKRITDFALPPPRLLDKRSGFFAISDREAPTDRPAKPVADATKKARRWSIELMWE
jgi:hypothetical protein